MTTMDRDYSLELFLLAMLVHERGGKFTVTQKAIDAFGDRALRQHKHPDGTVDIEVMSLADVEADKAALREQYPDVTIDESTRLSPALGIDQQEVGQGMHPLLAAKPQLLGAVITILVNKLAGLDTEVHLVEDDFKECSNKVLIQEPMDGSFMFKVLQHNAQEH